MRKTASEVLRVDDKLLSNLQTLVGDIMPGQTEEDDAAQEVRELCTRYINSQIPEH